VLKLHFEFQKVKIEIRIPSRQMALTVRLPAQTTFLHQRMSATWSVR